MPGKGHWDSECQIHSHTLARQELKWTTGGYHALRRCGCAWKLECDSISLFWNFAWDRLASRTYAATATTFLMELDYLYRYSPNQTPPLPKFTLCLPSARWGPRALDSQCSGKIARFRWISSNFTKTRLFYRFSRHLTLPMVVLTICLPPARWGPRAPDSQCSGNIARFRWISSIFIKTGLFI